MASAQSAALAAAFVWGAVGATVQALLLSTTGLATGFGMALPLGLSAWFAGFALGAALSSRLDTGVRTLVLCLGALLPYVALEVLLGLGARGATATSAGLACSALVAVAVDAIDTDIDKALTRATKKAGKAIDKGDVAAALEDLEKGLDKSANIAGE